MPMKVNIDNREKVSILVKNGRRHPKCNLVNAGKFYPLMDLTSGSLPPTRQNDLHLARPSRRTDIGRHPRRSPGRLSTDVALT